MSTTLFALIHIPRIAGRFTYFFLFTIVASLLFAPPAWGLDVQQLGTIGGISQALAVRGQYACIGEGLFLTIIDITDAAHPVEVSRLKMPNTINEISLAGSTAWVICGNQGSTMDTSGVFAVDISDPLNPKLTGQVSEGSVTDFIVEGQWAFRAAGASLSLYNITDPLHPVYAGRAPDPAPAMRIAYNSLRVADGRLYAANDAAGGGVLIFDISRLPLIQYLGLAPGRPPENAYSEGTQDLASSGSLVYSLDHKYLRIQDATQPTSPTLRSETILPYGGDARLALRGSHVYIVNGHNGILMTYDVSTPVKPELVSTSSFGMPVALEAPPDSPHLFYCDQLRGLGIIDVTTPTQPVLAGAWPSAGYLTKIKANIPYIYAVAADNAIKIIDFSDTEHPTVAGAVKMAGAVCDFDGEGQRLFVAETKDMAILDVSNPTSPTHIGTFYYPHDTQSPPADIYAMSLKVHAGKVLLAGRRNDKKNFGFLSIVDVKNPASPRELAWLPLTQAPQTIDLLTSAGSAGTVREYAYLGVSQKLQAVDMTDPLNPVMLGDILPGKIMESFKIFQQEGKSYLMRICRDLVGSNRLMETYDLSDPAHPALLSQREFSGQISQIAISGGIAVCSSYNALHFYSIQNPAEPVWFKWINLPDYFSGATYLDGSGATFFGTSSQWGLSAWRILPQQNDARMLSQTLTRGVDRRPIP